MENVRQYRDVKLVTTESTRNYLVSEPKCNTTKCFTKKLLTIEMKRTQRLMNRPVYLGLLILGDWTNERWIRQINHAKACWIRSKNI